MTYNISVPYAQQMADKTLKDVLDAAEGGTNLAQKLGISRAAISQWTRVPVNRVLEVEKITGISRHTLRPDIYGSEAKSVA